MKDYLHYFIANKNIFHRACHLDRYRVASYNCFLHSSRLTRIQSYKPITVWEVGILNNIPSQLSCNSEKIRRQETEFHNITFAVSR